MTALNKYIICTIASVEFCKMQTTSMKVCFVDRMICGVIKWISNGRVVLSRGHLTVLILLCVFRGQGGGVTRKPPTLFSSRNSWLPRLTGFVVHISFSNHLSTPGPILLHYVFFLCDLSTIVSYLTSRGKWKSVQLLHVFVFILLLYHQRLDYPFFINIPFQC